MTSQEIAEGYMRIQVSYIELHIKRIAKMSNSDILLLIFCYRKHSDKKCYLCQHSLFFYILILNVLILNSNKTNIDR